MQDSQSQSALIQLQGVGREFDTEVGRVHALQDVSLSIGAGEFVCITGDSGSGKSTLLNILGCLDRPTDGSYRFAGRDVGGLGDRALARLRRLAFGFVFQDYGLLDAMTALRNVALPAEYAGVSAENRKRQAEELLRSFGLDERQLHLPAELSGGEQQRVAIARALMNGRRIILADEPTGALDSRNSEQILSLFRSWRRRATRWSWSPTMQTWPKPLSAGFNCATAPSNMIRGRNGARRSRSGFRLGRIRRSSSQCALCSPHLCRPCGPDSNRSGPPDCGRPSCLEGQCWASHRPLRCWAWLTEPTRPA